MSVLLLGAVLVVAVVGWERVFIPWWEHRHERRKERLAACLREGHRWGEIFLACDDPRMPTRNCERCGVQQHLDRCPFCRVPVSRETGRPVEGGCE